MYEMPNFTAITICCFKKIKRKSLYPDPAEQLESGAAKTKTILKTPQQKGFYFFISKHLILTGKKHCGESRRCRNASAGPVYKRRSRGAALTAI